MTCLLLEQEPDVAPVSHEGATAVNGVPALESEQESRELRGRARLTATEGRGRLRARGTARR